MAPCHSSLYLPALYVNGWTLLLANKDILSNFCILSAQVEAERMKRAAVLKSEGKKKKKITRISNASLLPLLAA